MLLRDPHQLPARTAALSADVQQGHVDALQYSSDVYGWRPTWADTVLRARPLMISLWIVIQLASFNGMWRVGHDSALYRSVGHSLAIGHGYAISGEAHDHVYPGLPYLLAGLERVFGAEIAWPGVLAMLLSATLTVGFVYLLARRILPDWAATLVTAGVAFNWRFIQQAHELMTDAPFLLGVVLAMLGFDLTRHRRTLLVGVAVSVIGLALAAVMRPTAWVLFASAGLWASWLTVRNLVSRDPARRRRGYWFGGVVITIGSVVAGFLLLDPRTGTSGSFGQYEQELIDRFSLFVGDTDRLRVLPRALWTIVDDDLPRLFFGERVTGLNPFFTLALFGGVGLVALRRDDPSKRRPLWSLTVVVLVVVCLLLSSEPRYWLMVLPILWAGWLLGLMQGARNWFKTPLGRSRWVAAGLIMVFLGNSISIVKLIIEQRSTPFLESYKQGEYAPLEKFATTLRAGTQPGDVIIGPHASVLSYWTDRPVIGAREIGFGHISDTPGRIRAVRDSGATWMVFPHQPYDNRDDKLFRLIRQGLIYAANERDDEAITLEVIDHKQRKRTWWAAPFQVDERILPDADRKHWPAGERLPTDTGAK